MRLNLKKDFLLVTAMMVAAGCSDSMTEENNPEQQVPIAFGSQVATRAVVESDKEGMDNFTLWGWVWESDGPKLFFDAASVTPSGNYGEKRFWAVGRPYDFCASGRNERGWCRCRSFLQRQGRTQGYGF